MAFIGFMIVFFFYIRIKICRLTIKDNVFCIFTSENITVEKKEAKIKQNTKKTKHKKAQKKTQKNTKLLIAFIFIFSPVNRNI